MIVVHDIKVVLYKTDGLSRGSNNLPYCVKVHPSTQEELTILTIVTTLT